MSRRPPRCVTVALDLFHRKGEPALLVAERRLEGYERRQIDAWVLVNSGKFPGINLLQSSPQARFVNLVKTLHQNRYGGRHAKPA